MPRQRVRLHAYSIRFVSLVMPMIELNVRFVLKPWMSALRFHACISLLVRLNMLQTSKPQHSRLWDFVCASFAGSNVSVLLLCFASFELCSSCACSCPKRAMSDRWEHWDSKWESKDHHWTESSSWDTSNSRSSWQHDDQWHQSDTWDPVDDFDNDRSRKQPSTPPKKFPPGADWSTSRSPTGLKTGEKSELPKDFIPNEFFYDANEKYKRKFPPYRGTHTLEFSQWFGRS